MEQFGFTEYSWHEVGMRMDKPSKQLEVFLNQNFRLENYGVALCEIIFAFIVMLPDNPNHPDRQRFYRKKRILTMARNLDYQAFIQASEAEALQMIVRLYLESLRKYRKIKDFDKKRFCADLEQKFMEKGWL